MPQQMRRRGTGTALLSSSSLTTPATTTSTNSGGDSSSNLIDGVETRFVAETLLPTRLGKFRLRGYLHTVRLNKRKPGLSTASLSFSTSLAKFFFSCFFIDAFVSTSPFPSFPLNTKKKKKKKKLSLSLSLPPSATQLSQVDGGETYSEPSAVMTGSPEGLEDVPLRVHDACFTSEVLGSLKCDCAEQLQLALAHIQAEGTGIVIYLQQEGRGIGLANKIAAYALQEKRGLDTVDANRALGLPDDCREYSSVATILAGLGVRSVRLMTNNPRKVRLLQELGVRVTGRIPCLVQAQEFSARYLQTKGEKMDHIFGSLASEVAPISPTAVADAAARVSLEQESLLNRGATLSSDDMDGSFCEWEHGGGGVIEAAAGGDGTLTAAAAAVVSSSSSTTSSSAAAAAAAAAAPAAAAAAAAPPSSSPASSSSSSGPSSTVQPLHGRMSRRQSPLVRPKRGSGGGGEGGGAGKGRK